MEIIDMRKLSPAARQERRRQVIKLRRKGLSYEAIAAELGLSRTGVFNICKRFDEGGAAALRDQPCGRPTGASRALSAEQAQTHSLVESVFSGNGLRQQNIPMYGSRIRIQGRTVEEALDIVKEAGGPRKAEVPRGGAGSASLSGATGSGNKGK